jgi:hypothetical protein
MLPSSGRYLPSHYLATGLDATVPICHTSRNSAVGMATGYGLNGRGVGVQVPVGARFVSSERRPGWFCDPPSRISNGYRGLFPRR